MGWTPPMVKPEWCGGRTGQSSGVRFLWGKDGPRDALLLFLLRNPSQPAVSLGAANAPEPATCTIARRYLVFSDVLEARSTFLAEEVASARSRRLAAPGAAALALLPAEHQPPLEVSVGIDGSEVEVVEAIVRFCYELQTSDPGAPLAAPAQLLQTAWTASRFGMPLCVAHCMELLLQHCPEAFGDAASCSALMAGFPSEPEHQGACGLLQASVTDRLLQLLGEGEAVGQACYEADNPLCVQLRALSLPALLLLLSSDRLHARSENTVLMMADAWMAGPIGASCSAAQQKEVAKVIRLSQLTKAFAFDVVHKLTWLQLTDAELHFLVRWSEAVPEVPGQAAPQTAEQTTLIDYGVPNKPAWFGGVRRAAWTDTASLTMPFQLTSAELRDFCSHCVPGQLPVQRGSQLLFLSGFTVQAVLCVHRPGALLEARFGHSVTLHRPWSSDAPIPLLLSESTAAVSYMESSGLPFAGKRHQLVLNSRQVSGLFLFPKVDPGELQNAARWSPYVLKDRLFMVVDVWGVQ